MAEGARVRAWSGNDLSGAELGSIRKECGMWSAGDDDVVGISEGMLALSSLEWVMRISLSARTFYSFEVRFSSLKERFSKRKNISNDPDPSDAKMAAVLVDRTVMPWLPPVSFAERPELEVMPSAEEIKAKGLNRPDIRQPEATDFACMVRDESRLLALPLELRLAIYYWVYLMTPVHHAQLAPWYPVPYQKEYVARAVSGRRRRKGEEADGDEDGEAAMGRLLSSKRPLCGMPTTLLRANREIYHEARTIPFIYNEFVFVNWFSSGVWAARSFTRHLRPWQLSSLRQLRLELLSRDLMGSGTSELSHVCTSLATGLQGLRLKIAPGGSSLGLAWLKDKAESWTGDVSEGRIGWGWVEDGIAKLKGLKRMEIEVEVPSWGDEEKVAWCRRLEGVLRGGGMETEVVCVEGVGESREKNVGKLLEEMAMERM